MRRPVLPPALAPLGLLATALLGGCSGGARASLPDADFVVAAGDTSLWVRTSSRGVELRRAPLVLARVDGRFHELYVTEDDYSFHDAVFLSQAVWRRDLETNDSVLVHADTVVAASAREWLAEHPDDRLLEPDEQEAEEPAVTAIYEAGILDVHGPLLAVETFTDLHDADGGEWHRTRRLLIDLRSGAPVSLAALVGDGEAARVTHEARRGFERLRDSALAQVGTRDDGRAARALQQFVFDSASFAIAAARAHPSVVFYVAGQGGESDGYALPLGPVAVPAADWWRAGLSELPVGDAAAALALADEEPDTRAGRVQRWAHGGFELLARYDSSGEAVRLSLRDARGREHPVGRVGAPVRRVHWLDAPPLDAAARRALRQAFYDASLHGGSYQPAAARPRAGAPRVRLTALLDPPPAT